MRLIDEFLAKSRTAACTDFKDSTEKVAKVLHHAEKSMLNLVHEPGSIIGDQPFFFEPECT